MYCTKCGNEIENEDAFCPNCGKKVDNSNIKQKQSISRVGYSKKINDQAFDRYLRNERKWALYFTLFISFIAIGGFFIYGQTSSEMENPMAVLIGIGIALLFLIIFSTTTNKKSKSKTWEGVVCDKKIKKRQRISENTETAIEEKIYIVTIKDDQGKMHEIKTRKNDTIYNYYKIGDKVLHHGRLNSYEKYDKTGDKIMFCNACGTVNDINEEYCYRCKCPLLK